METHRTLTPEMLKRRPEDESGLLRLTAELELMSLDTVKTELGVSSAATLSIEGRVSGLTCFLFEGSVESYCDDATWSVSAEVSMSAYIG